MKALRTTLLAALTLASVATPFFWHHRWVGQLQAKESALRTQTELLARANFGSPNTSNAVSLVKVSSELSAAELDELLKLRNEVSQARKATNQIILLQREIRRLREGADDMPTNSGFVVPNALLNDELPQRMQQVGWLKNWLEENPSEKTPELTLLKDLDWIRLTDQPWVKTDDENRQTMSQVRLRAQDVFDKMTFDAVQQFALANQGRFPADVMQLKPYFESPVGDTIFQRYQIVDAGSLNMRELAHAVGEPVITLKTPVNPELDARTAVGQKRIYRSSREPGRWDPLK